MGWPLRGGMGWRWGSGRFAAVWDGRFAAVWDASWIARLAACGTRYAPSFPQLASEDVDVRGQVLAYAPFSDAHDAAASRGVVGFEVILGAYSPLSMAAMASVSLSG